MSFKERVSETAPSVNSYGRIKYRKISEEVIINSLNKTNVRSLKLEKFPKDVPMERMQIKTIRVVQTIGATRDIAVDEIQTINESVDNRSHCEGTTTCDGSDGNDFPSSDKFCNKENLRTYSAKKKSDEMPNKNKNGQEEQTKTTEEENEKNWFDELCSKREKIQRPQGWFEPIYEEERDTPVKKLSFLKIVSKRINDVPQFLPSKTVSIGQDFKINVVVYGLKVNLEQVNIPSEAHSEEEFVDILHRVDDMKICPGAFVGEVEVCMKRHKTVRDLTTKWRSLSCPLLINESQCKSCITLCKAVAQKVTKSKEQKIKTGRARGTAEDCLRRKVKNLTASCTRAQKNLKLLRRCQHRLSNFDLTAIDELLSNEKCKIPEEQRTLIKEIVKSSKRKSPKGNRYSDNWILHSILLHTKSPTTYRYLRDNNYLPLPDPRTIRLYLAKINTRCGFDPNFFKLFKQMIMSRPPGKRHGLITLDEIALRKGVAVDQTTCKIRGLTDFGNAFEGCPEAKSLDDKATHGLVFMWQPLEDDYVQPLGCFASNKPVKGIVLGQLLNLAISYVEQAGAFVHGIVSDGASTNKKMWETFGLSAKKDNVRCSFEHPLDPDRKIFMFSDTPHIIKNLRNRLHDKKILIVSKEGIKITFSKKCKVYV